MLHLDPSRPPVWRDTRTLQFGVPRGLRLVDPTPWQEILLRSLASGISGEDAVAIASSYDADRAAVEAFLHALDPVLVSAPERPRAALRVADPIDGAIAVHASRLLSDHIDLVRDPDEATTVILLESFVPDPARYVRLMRDDVPHLPLVLAGDRITVGPFVTPGAGACLACDAAARRDADPLWPSVASQLMSRPGAPTSGTLLAEAVTFAGRALSGQIGSRLHSHAVTFVADSARRRWDARRPHPACACRSPEGNAIPAWSIVPSSTPTRETAYARPA